MQETNIFVHTIVCVCVCVCVCVSVCLSVCQSVSVTQWNIAWITKATAKAVRVRVRVNLLHLLRSCHTVQEVLSVLGGGGFGLVQINSHLRGCRLLIESLVNPWLDLAAPEAVGRGGSRGLRVHSLDPFKQYLNFAPHIVSFNLRGQS